MRLKRIERWQLSQRLLLLRVFARDKRGEQLLDEVAFHWRFIGPIHMIGGPDLAKSNLDLHELFFFLSRRLRELFVTDRRSLTVHLAAIDEHADPDERYRINEYFCSDDMWQEAVEQLVGHCDAVLLDLRDFSAERRGDNLRDRTIGQERRASSHCVHDQRPDGHESMEEEMAKVPAEKMPPERVLRSDGAVKGNDLFRVLAGAANTE